MSNITTIHRGITIEYLETRDEWTCEKFTHGSATLRLARERINKLLDTEKKTPFKRFKAFTKDFGHREGWKEVEITSLTEDKNEAFASYEGKRQKLGRSYDGSRHILHIYPATPENTDLITSIRAKQKTIETLISEVGQLESRLTPYTPE